MVLSAYMTIEGANLGAFKGSVREKSRKGTIGVIAVDHMVGAELEDGKAGDGRRDGVVRVRKEIDAATPKLHEAHASNERLNSVSIYFLRVPPFGGAEESHATLLLANARIASIRTVMENIRQPQFAAMPEYEEIEFAYEAIATTWRGATGSGATMVDSGAISADFRKSEAKDVVSRIASGIAQDIGKEVATKVAEFLKTEAKKIVTEALKEQKGG